MSRKHEYSVAAHAGQMPCAPIKSQLLPVEALLFGIINGLFVLIIFAGLVVSEVAYAVAISRLVRDFLVAQSESAGRHPGCALACEGSGC
jgi:hypothetical protein